MLPRLATNPGECWQVVGEERRGAPTLIVACPSVDLIPSLISHAGWERFYAGDAVENVSSDEAKGDKKIGSKGRGGSSGGGGSGSKGHFDFSPCVVHMAPADVMSSPAYQAWSRRFGKSATHLVMARPYCSPHTLYQVPRAPSYVLFVRCFLATWTSCGTVRFLGGHICLFDRRQGCAFSYR